MKEARRAFLAENEKEWNKKRVEERALPADRRSGVSNAAIRSLGLGMEAKRQMLDGSKTCYLDNI
jgi:hypothetical protein